MPWNVEKRGNKWAVVVTEGPSKGKIVSTHDSAEKARRHVKALYANTSYSAQDRLAVKLVRSQ